MRNLECQELQGKLKSGKGKGNKPQFQKSKENDEKRENRFCRYCKKPGHLTKNCFKWKRKQNEEAQAQGASDMAQEPDVEHVLNVVSNCATGKWIIDSDCKFHICSHREWFHEIESSQGSILLGNNQICVVQGIGKIWIRLSN